MLRRSARCLLTQFLAIEQVCALLMGRFAPSACVETWLSGSGRSLWGKEGEGSASWRASFRFS